MKAGDNDALLAMFAPDAEILAAHARVVKPSLDLVSRIAMLNPHASLVSATLKDLVAGGTDSALWLDAEVEVVLSSSEEGGAGGKVVHPMRIVELLDGATGKIVTGSFAQPAPAAQLGATHGELPNPTDAGALSKLLTAPADAANALASGPDTFVLGTELAERAVGADAARKLLGQWTKLKLTLEEQDKVHEVHAAGWGYAMGNVNLVKGSGDPYRMTGLVIAVPTTGGAGWSVVAIVYDAI